MKGKEYFEKYFGDVSKAELPDKILDIAKELTKEMTLEALALCDARHSKTNSSIDAALKEMNRRFNSVAVLCEKKYGVPVLKRNSFLKYWESQFTKEGLERA